jgi:hypothetical protein
VQFKYTAAVLIPDMNWFRSLERKPLRYVLNMFMKVSMCRSPQLADSLLLISGMLKCLGGRKAAK